MGGHSVTWELVGHVKFLEPHPSPTDPKLPNSGVQACGAVFKMPSGDSKACSVLRITALRYRLTFTIWPMTQVTWLRNELCQLVLSSLASHPLWAFVSSFFHARNKMGVPCRPFALIKCCTSISKPDSKSLKWCDCSFPGWWYRRSCLHIFVGEVCGFATCGEAETAHIIDRAGTIHKTRLKNHHHQTLSLTVMRELWPHTIE